MKTLKQAKIGETVRVVKLHGEGAVKRRIMDMGLTKGVEVNVRKVAPLGDPIEVTVRGYELSLRKAEKNHLYFILYILSVFSSIRHRRTAVQFCKSDSELRRVGKSAFFCNVLYKIIRFDKQSFCKFHSLPQNIRM